MGEAFLLSETLQGLLMLATIFYFFLNLQSAYDAFKFLFAESTLSPIF